MTHGSWFMISVLFFFVLFFVPENNIKKTKNFQLAAALFSAAGKQRGVVRGL